MSDLRRAASGFRFAPPPLERSPELEWVLRAAFSLPARRPPGDAAAAARLAQQLGLGPRIAHRLGAERLAAELGDSAEPLAQARRASVARAMILESAIAACCAAAAELGVPLVPLKGMALWLRGAASNAERPAADADLLAPEESVGRLQARLLGHGFHLTGEPAYEHQAPSIRHPSGGVVELHRCLPGVRLDGRRSATFADCRSGGWLEPLPPVAGRALGEVAGEARAVLFLPRRPLLAAHLLAHALAQDAFSPAGVGLRWLADLSDLEREPASARPAATLRDDLAALREALAADLSAQEIEAALGLVAALGEGRIAGLLVPGSSEGALLAHVVLGITDRDYAAALRLRFFERPLSDRPRYWARLLAVVAAVWPGRRRGGALGETGANGGAVEPWRAYLARLSGRPRYLWARWRAAREGQRKLSGSPRRE